MLISGRKRVVSIGLQQAVRVLLPGQAHKRPMQTKDLPYGNIHDCGGSCSVATGQPVSQSTALASLLHVRVEPFVTILHDHSVSAHTPHIIIRVQLAVTKKSHLAMSTLTLCCPIECAPSTRLSTPYCLQTLTIRSQGMTTLMVGQHLDRHHIAKVTVTEKERGTNPGLETIESTTTNRTLCSVDLPVACAWPV